MPIIGPLFAWDLTRLARRGQDAKSRTLLALVLLATMIIFAMVWFRTLSVSDLFFGTERLLSIQESAVFAEQFARSLMLAQLLVLVLLTPAYAAGSIAEEKELQSWAFLLSTPLSNREIVFGKFAARVVFLLGVLVAGFPVMALTAMLGGVDPLTLIGGYAVTAGSVLLISAISILAAILSHNYRIAMIRAYAFTFMYAVLGGGISFFLNPFAVIITLSQVRDDLTRFLKIGGAYVVVQLLVTAVLLVVSIRSVRRPERVRRNQAARPVAKPVRGAEPAAAHDRESRIGTTTMAIPSRPPLGDRDPLEWKERYIRGDRPSSVEESTQGLMVLGTTLFAGLFILIFTLATITESTGFSSSRGNTPIVLGVIALYLHLVIIGPSTFGALIRERRRKTLDGLLVLPVDRRELLLPRWNIAFQRQPTFAIAAFAGFTFGYFSANQVFAAVPAGAYVVAASAFAVSFGLWLGTFMGSMRQAMVVYVALCGVVACVPLIVHLSFDLSMMILTAVVMSAAVAVMAGGAAWFWWRAVSEFEVCGRD